MRSNDVKDGDRFGRWTVIKAKPAPGIQQAICVCDCGTERVIYRSQLAQGKVSSCGCARREAKAHKARLKEEKRAKAILAKLEVAERRALIDIESKKMQEIRRACSQAKKEAKAAKSKAYKDNHEFHGLSKTRTYKIWKGMRGRCSENSTDLKKRKIYSDLGVKVCERWSSFLNFLSDMGEAPEGLSIDRYPDPSGNYEPGNCRWATTMQQAHNKRKTHYAKIGKDICEAPGVAA